MDQNYLKVRATLETISLLDLSNYSNHYFITLKNFSPTQEMLQLEISTDLLLSAHNMLCYVFIHIIATIVNFVDKRALHKLQQLNLN